MRIKNNEIIESPFFGNYFCLIPNTNLAFLVISKNACSFLKKVAIYNKTNEWLNEKQFEIHSAIGFKPEKSEYLATKESLKILERERGEKFKTFAVWRDPVLRIQSAYKLFCLKGEPRHYFIYLDINKKTSFDRFMEFVRFESGKTNPLFIDEHIRKQVDYISGFDVDEIVHIDCLFDFLNDNNIPFINEKSNQTKSSFRLTDMNFINEIKELYKEDYNIRITRKPIADGK